MVERDEMVHFVLEAVELVDFSRFCTKKRGCGSAQFPPRMMLALVMYCYSHGICSSRRIVAATHYTFRYAIRAEDARDAVEQWQSLRETQPAGLTPSMV